MKHYRIRERHEHNGVNVYVEVWNTFKETPKGYWIKHKYLCEELNDILIPHYKRTKMLRWVSKDSVRKYAYPTVKEALNSFRIRKQRQNNLIKLQLEVSDLVVANLGKILEQPEEVLESGFNLGETPSHYMYDFD